MSDVLIEIGAETSGFRRAGRELSGLQRSVEGAATAVKGFVGLQVAKELVGMASAAADFAKAGDEARRVASAFTGDLKKLKAASFNSVDDTTLQKLDQLTQETQKATGITQDLSAALLLASERYSRGLGGSVAENATAIVTGEAEAMKKLGINIDMTDSRLQGLDESRKKAMITAIAASQASEINAASIDKEAFALSSAQTGIDNLVSDLQVMTSEFLVNSGVLEIVSKAVKGLSGWFAENKEIILAIGERALGIMTHGFEQLGPVLEVVADVVLVLADGLTTLVQAAQDAADFLNPFSSGIEDVDFKAMAADASVDTLEGGIRDMGNAAATSAAQVRGLIAAQSALAQAGADPRQVLNDFEKLRAELGSTELALADVELSGQTALLLGAASTQRDAMEARAAQIDSLATRARSVSYGGENYGNERAIRALSQELEAAGLNADLTADQLRIMSLDAADAAMKWEGVTRDIADNFTADDPGGVGGAAKAATKEVDGLVASLERAGMAVRGSFVEAKSNFGYRLDDSTRNAEVERQRALEAQGLALFDSIGNGIVDLTAQAGEAVGMGSWESGIFSQMLFGEEPDILFERMAALSESISEISDTWNDLTAGMKSEGVGAASGLLAMFETFTANAPEIQKASKTLEGGFGSTASAIGTLASTGIGAMGAFTGAMIEDQKVQAGIMSAFEAAQSLASWPDPIGVATHAAASALFASVAAGAFDSAGGRGGARGAASAGAAFGAPTLADSFSRNDDRETRETMVVQLQLDRRVMGEAVIEGVNDVSSTYRRPARITQRSIGGNERRMWG